MSDPLTTPDERRRLAALAEYKVLDTGPERSFDDITRIASLICGTPIALVSFVDAEREWFKSRLGFEVPQTAREAAFSAHAILREDLFVVPDAAGDCRFSGNALLAQDPSIRFYAGAPLVSPEGHVLGTLSVIDRAPRELSPGQADALRALGRQIVAQLELRRANQCMKRDLDMAVEVQRSLLPTEPLVDTRARFAWSYEPSEELGGDILNVFAIDAHRLGCFVADVSGHGVAAALLAMAVSRALSPLGEQRSLVREPSGAAGRWRATPPAVVATQLNTRFQIDETTGQYFTLLYGLIDHESREFRFTSAGHPGPVYMRPGERPRVLRCAGEPVGMYPAPDYEEHAIPIRPGDRLFLYSDGLTEAVGVGDEEFGERRLLEEIHRTRDVTLEESVRSLHRAAESWASAGLRDDVAILAVEMAPG